MPTAANLPPPLAFHTPKSAPPPDPSPVNLIIPYLFASPLPGKCDRNSKTRPPVGRIIRDAPIEPLKPKSSGRDDHSLAFEVTSAERIRLGRPSSFLNGKERKQAVGYSNLFAQLGGLGDAAST